MSSETLVPGGYYVPNAQAWERYKDSGGSVSLKARTVTVQQDNLVQLSGIPSYWWRASELSTDAPHPQMDVPKPAKEPMCVIEVPIHRFESTVCTGDLQIEYEDSDERDEDCQGEECEECGGDGCTVSKEPLLASSLLEHLLASYDNSAETYASEHDIDRCDVDTIYKDLLILVSSIRCRG